MRANSRPLPRGSRRARPPDAGTPAAPGARGHGPRRSTWSRPRWRAAFLAGLGTPAALLSGGFALLFDDRHRLLARRTERHLAAYLTSPRGLARDVGRLARLAAGARFIVNDSLHPAALALAAAPAIAGGPRVVNVHGDNLWRAAVHNFDGRAPDYERRVPPPARIRRRARLRADRPLAGAGGSDRRVRRTEPIPPAAAHGGPAPPARRGAPRPGAVGARSARRDLSEPAFPRSAPGRTPRGRARRRRNSLPRRVRALGRPPGLARLRRGFRHDRRGERSCWCWAPGRQRWSRPAGPACRCWRWSAISPSRR